MKTEQQGAPKSAQSIKHTNSNTQLNKLGKLDSMLLRFADGETHNRFSAERVGDHALPSTIADLQKRHGIYFHREWEGVPNRFGSTTRVMCYWLQDENLVEAKKYFGLDQGVSA